MNTGKEKILIFSLIFLLFVILLSFFYINKFEKEKKSVLEPISLNLLTSVHPKLDWNFKPVKSKISVKPGEVTTIEYIVENLGNKATTGIATFIYFPSDRN